MSENKDSDDSKNHWENILAQADIKTIPLRLVREITISLPDGSQEILDVKSLFENNVPLKTIKRKLKNFIDAHEKELYSVGIDYHINLEALAEEVGEHTKRLLG